MENYVRKEVDEYGNAFYYNAKKHLHRTDGPAIEYAYGVKQWFIDGKLHREDGPAVEQADGYKCWYRKGKYHRVNGPAVIYLTGAKAYYLHGHPYTYSIYSNFVLFATLEPTRIDLNQIRE